MYFIQKGCPTLSAYQSTDKIQKYIKYGVLVNDLDGINIKEWIKVSATVLGSVKKIREEMAVIA